MSNVVKGVKKVFKKIVKVVKKVAPIILAAAAIYFTAGAVLALPGTAAGLGGAVNAITAGLGDGILGGVVRGALTSAAKGAAIGGIASSVTGGSFTKGAQAGAVTGAVVGGVSGGFNARLPAGGGDKGGLVDSGTVTTSPLDPAALGDVTPVNAAGDVAGPPGLGFGEQGAVEEVSRSGLLPRVGEFITKNQDLVGGAIKGIGAGLVAGATADADMDLLRERSNITRENYAGTDPGRNFSDVTPRGQSGLRYDPSNYGSFQYEYDPKQQKIIKVPVG